MVDYAYLIQHIVYSCTIGALTGVWAFLFTGPLSEPGMVFGWLKGTVYRACPEWLYLPLIGCAKCSAFWWAVLVWRVTGEFSPPVFVVAVFVAYWLEKQQQ